jgi:tetratricopeptide (TPR) repeat protein
VNHKAQELVQKGDKFVVDGRYEEALLYYEEALAMEPNNPNLLNKKGIALRSLGRYDEAVECFNKSLQISPRDLDAS